MPSGGRRAHALDLPLGLVSRPPGEHGVGQDVVIDLVARQIGAAYAGDRPEDALSRQQRQYRLKLLRRRAQIAGKVGRVVRDLGSRWRHEMVEDRGRDVLLLVVERGERLLQVVADDLLRSPELFERLEPKNNRALLRLGRPQPGHHELEKRCLDAAWGAVCPGSSSCPAELDFPGRDLVEHGLDERRLHVHRPVCRGLVVTVDRAEDRFAPRDPVETLESKIVPEHVRNTALEPVELGQRVLAHGEEEARADSRSGSRLGELIQEAARADVRPVVEGLLLEPVQDYEHFAARQPCPELERVGQPPLRLCARRLCDPRLERTGRIVPPVGEHDDRHRLRERAQVAGHPSAQHGALSDPALAVEHRQARREQVGDDDLALALSTEEQARVRVRILERGEALERAVGARRAHRATSVRLRSNAAAKSSSPMSRASMPRWRHSSRSTRPAPGTIAHDR